MIAGDTYGGYGAGRITLNGAKVPMTISINGGAATAFNTANFPQGSGDNSITLTADTDWSNRGPLMILNVGMKLDLNGHKFTLKDIHCDDYVGSCVTNSASGKSVMFFTGEPTDAIASKNGVIKRAGDNIILAKAGSAIATWTGAACDGNPATANNWEDSILGGSVVPTAAYDVVINGSGTFNMTGGKLTVSRTNRPLWLGGEQYGTGTFNIGGTADATFCGIDMGRMFNAKGCLNQTGGTLTIKNGDGFNIGRDAAGTYVQDGGTFNTNSNRIQFILRKDGSDKVLVDKSDTVFADNVKYHIVVTVKANADGTSTIRLVRTNVADSSDKRDYTSTSQADWTIRKLIGGNFYIGHSQWSSDKDANAKYDEVRIWNGILSDAAIALSYAKGPDATTADLAEVVAASDATRTIEVATEGTLDLGVHTLRHRSSPARARSWEALSSRPGFWPGAARL